jgi:ATP-dependent protease ClpP protease subunit
MAESIYIDGYIGSDFFSEGVTVKWLREQVNALPQGTNEFTLHINSGGGDVIEGFAIYDYLVALKTKSGFSIKTEGQGIVGSIATVIFQAGDTRELHPNTEFFIHNPYVTPFGEPMDASKAGALADMLQKTEDKILDFYVKHTKKSEEDIKAKMNAQTSFTATEAVEWGFADTVLTEAAQNFKQYAVMACISNNSNNNKMDILKTLNEFESRIMGAIDKISAPKIKNEMHETSEGVQVFYDGDLEIGKQVWLDEAMTQPAPDGVHTVDGVQFTIVGGKVESVGAAAAAEDEATKALKAEVEALKAQLAEKEAALTNATTEVTTLKAEVAEAVTTVNEVKLQFQNFKSQIVTEDGNLKPEVQNFKDEKQGKPSLVSQTLELRKQKTEKK